MKLIYPKIFIVFFLFHLFPTKNFSQAPSSHTSAEILLKLKKLNTLGSVLYIAAHPDDENTRLLSYLSKEKLYRTGYLSLTRGDGGQNLIGDEQGVTLGLIRTQELMSARRIDDAEQFFATAYDFGFSKNADETFKIWNKRKILSDVVWVIRKFQPDVIITRFPEDSRAGHGQHAASAILAREAFFAAANPDSFPEHFPKGVKVWQAKRLLWNSFNFGNADLTSDTLHKIDVGGYNALLGKSYGEIASESRSQHKSQGFGGAASRGTTYEYFRTVAGKAPVNNLMDGVDIGWKRTGNASVTADVENIIRQFDPQEPEKSVEALIKLKDYLQTHIYNSYWVIHKLDEIGSLIRACTGLFAEAVANQQFAVYGDSLKVTFNAINRSKVPITKFQVIYDDTLFILADTLKYNSLKAVQLTRLIKRAPLADQPYWLRDQMTEGSFTVKDQQLIGLPENKKDQVKVMVTIAGTNIRFEMPLQYKHTDPVKGEIYQPVITVPSMLVSIAPAVVLTKVIPAFKQDIEVKYQSQINGSPQPGEFVFYNSGSVIARRPVVFEKVRNKSQSVFLPLDSILAVKKNTELSVSLITKSVKGEETFSNHIRLINYDHIPTVHYIYQSRIKVVNEEIRTIGRKIGYIKGAGDNVPEALHAMGYEVVMLDKADLNPGSLKSFDAVITGIRAYNVHEYLADKYDILMDYVKEGGNLIVQYNTSNFVSSVKSKIGPYPFNISRSRVTEEQASVNFLKPQHDVLNFPNKIGPADFDNWTQERGIYFADQLDPKYETIFSMNDPGEQEQKGSLIIADYGRGKFVYTGLVFFRQLPAGVPGAYRLLANIIALNKKQGF
jgi:LmbE family N-acetylglucosaminyl deacetylase